MFRVCFNLTRTPAVLRGRRSTAGVSRTLACKLITPLAFSTLIPANLRNAFEFCLAIDRVRPLATRFRVEFPAMEGNADVIAVRPFIVAVHDALATGRVATTALPAIISANTAAAFVCVFSRVFRGGFDTLGLLPNANRVLDGAIGLEAFACREIAPPTAAATTYAFSRCAFKRGICSIRVLWILFAKWCLSAALKVLLDAQSCFMIASAALTASFRRAGLGAASKLIFSRVAGGISEAQRFERKAVLIDVFASAKSVTVVKAFTRGRVAPSTLTAATNTFDSATLILVFRITSGIFLRRCGQAHRSVTAANWFFKCAVRLEAETYEQITLATVATITRALDGAALEYAFSIIIRCGGEAYRLRCATDGLSIRIHATLGALA